MVSSLDIFGLGLGFLYAVTTPIAAYILFRNPLNLKLRDIGVGAVGYFATDGLHKALVRPALMALIEAMQSANYYPSPSVFRFFENWSSRSAFAVQSELICFLLLSFFASQRKGMGPGVAYGVGAAGVYCVAFRAHIELQHLQWAVATDENGPEALFGARADSPGFLVRMFSYGIPYGVGSIVHFLIAIGLCVLVWRGVLEAKWKLVGLAVAIDVALAAPLPLIDALQLPISPNTYDSLLGLLVVACLFWRGPLSEWSTNRFRTWLDREARQSGLIGLFSSWLRQHEDRG
jgi:uncharacterized membrane protein YhfC